MSANKRPWSASGT
ncbi:hypothetical protein AYI70_g589, partial [Smittium culicis]